MVVSSAGASPTPPAHRQLPSNSVLLSSSEPLTPSARVIPYPGLGGSQPRVNTPIMGGNTHNPYGHLSPQQRASMDAELRGAELQYGEKMRAADAMPDVEARRSKLDALKNSFGTKQSMIRKKYGVRLRERRTRAEIDAERSRMGISGGRRSSGAPPAAGTPPRAQPAAPATASSTPPSSTPLPPSAGGWVAANTPRAPRTSGTPDGHDAKRARMDDGSAARPVMLDEDEELARKTAATRQQQQAPSSQFRVGDSIVRIHEPEGEMRHPAEAVAAAALAIVGLTEDDDATIADEDEMPPANESSVSADGNHAPTVVAGLLTENDRNANGVAGEPLPGGSGTDHGRDMSSDDDDDGDIPPKLPAAVMQSLGSNQAS
jgi:hypothetical protein